MVRNYSTYLMVLVLFLAGVLIGTPAIGDDGGVLNVGGVVRAMEDHPTIELVAEHVHATISKRWIDVECVFFFRNNGEPTTVTMGFPDRSSSDYHSHVQESYFTFFESFVDGDKVKVAPTRGADDPNTYWWTKDVSFGANETKVIRNLYRSQASVPSPGEFAFHYILETGSSWAGPIGVASIVVSLKDVDLGQIVRVRPADCSMSDGEVRWTLRDFEPEENILVHWKAGVPK